MVKLAWASSQLPSSLFLKNVIVYDRDIPAYGGAYADVFRGELDGKAVALKRFRTWVRPYKQNQYPHVSPTVLKAIAA